MQSTRATTDFYFFRHSETFRNKEGIEIQGWIDDAAAQLTPHGEQLAEQLGEALFELIPDATAIYTSDISRCKDTAKKVGAKYGNQIPIFPTEKLREKCHAQWDTMSVKERNAFCCQYYSQQEAEYKASGDRFAKWKVEPLSTGKIAQKQPNCPDKLESIYDVYCRVRAFIKETARIHMGGKVFISTHGAVCDTMREEATERQQGSQEVLPAYFEEKSRKFPKNCAIYHFQWDHQKEELTFVREVALDDIIIKSPTK